MPDWLQALLFLATGGVLTWAGTVVNHVLENQRLKRGDDAAKLAEIQRSIIADYVDNGTSLVQLELAAGLSRVDQIETLVKSLAVVHASDANGQKETLDNILKITFTPDSRARVLGMVRLSTFGMDFEDWGTRAFRVIELYMGAAHSFAKDMLGKIGASGGPLSKDQVSKGNHLIAEGKLLELLLGTVMQAIKDFDNLSVYIRDASYGSHVAAAVAELDTEDRLLGAMREAAGNRVVEYDKREQEGLTPDEDGDVSDDSGEK